MSGILLATVGNSYGSAPVNTVAPVVSGTATVGQTLSTTNGTWLGAPAPTFTYQWQRTGVDIGGATSSTYVLVAADYANTIRCVVRATNSVAPAGVTANSNSTASVAGNAPVNTVAPAVTGTATFGQTLTTTNGTWTGTPTPTFTYQWQRVTTNISGATSSTYVLVAADVGNTIRCVVTATNAVSAVSANSNSTAAVSAAVPGAPTIGTATISGITASVPFTAPASNGGATITTYTATSTPSSITGTLSQAGSGTVTVSGLNPGTSYTFTVTATNSAGTGPASAASNSVTAVAPAGQSAYASPGTFSFTVPAGVTSIAVVCVGASAGAGDASVGGSSGAGAGLSYVNNIATTPGETLTVQVGQGTAYAQYTGTNIALNRFSFLNRSSTTLASAICRINSGNLNVDSYFYEGGYPGVGTGGTGGGGPFGGGGAGGYAGNGGSGNSGSGTGQAGAGGGGGGGAGLGLYYAGCCQEFGTGYGGGGGVGILGEGSSGAGGTVTNNGASNATSNGGGGGSGGSSGGRSGVNGNGGNGGSYGGGGGSKYNFNGGAGNSGAVRIIWAGGSGITREFPSTNTGNL